MTTSPPRREFAFTLPIGIVDHESQNGASSETREVVLRKMTGKEEAILADKRYQRNGGKLVTEMLYSTIVRVGKNSKVTRKLVADMYSADRNFLLLALRSITFGPELRTTYSCPACGENMHMVENLEELPMKPLANGESVDDIVVELEDGYYDNDGTIHTAMRLRLPTGADEEAVATQMRQNASLGKNALLARCLRSLGDMAPHRVEALGQHIFSELTLTDRRLIDQAMNQAAPGVDLTRELECPNCGNEFKASLDLSNFLALE